MVEFDFSKINFLSDEEIENKKKQEFEEKKHGREIAFKKLMPRSFQDTDVGRLSKMGVKEARAWTMTPETCKLNCLIYGPSGTGKTRLSWMILRRRYIDYGQTSKAIGAETFTRRMQHEKFLMGEMIRVPLLLLDDIGKERATPTAESYIFELVRERMDHCRPTIYTTNYSNKEFTDRFNHVQVGNAIARRLEESCQLIPLK